MNNKFCPPLKLFYLLIFFILYRDVFANDSSLQASFDVGQALAKVQRSTPSQMLSTLQPNDIFAHFNPTPSQSKYYQSETATAASLTQETLKQSSDNTAVKVINDSIKQHPPYTVETQSLGIKRSQTILNDAAAISQGLLNHYSNCKKTQQCTITYTNEQCQESKLPREITCTKDLMVNAIPGPSFETTLSLSIQGTLRYSHTQTILLDLSKSLNSFLADIRISQSSLLPNNYPCQNLKTSIVENKSLYVESPTILEIKQLPECTHPYQLIFSIQSPQNRELPSQVAGKVTLHITSQSPPTLQESWQTNCPFLNENGFSSICNLEKNERCTSGKASKIINGITINRDCWQTQTMYQCHVDSNNACDTLREKGCEQIGSSCSDPSSSPCFNYQQTFRCPKEKCTDDVGIVCNGETYCFSGECTHPKREADLDFQSSVSKLAAIGDASKQFDSSFIFKGVPARCSNDAVGYRNCCRDSGWGIDLNLAHCDEEEKQLGLNKLKGLTVYIGENCAHRILGMCRSKQKVYCTFPSKLARLIQQQGRQQLGLSFGKGNQPNCNGLTPEQLQHINFDKINFSEYYNDLPTHEQMTSSTNKQEMIEQHVKQWEEGMRSHENN